MLDPSVGVWLRRLRMTRPDWINAGATVLAVTLCFWIGPAHPYWQVAVAMALVVFVLRDAENIT